MTKRPFIASTKITYIPETCEYRVRLFIRGVYQAGADYFTDDKEDAKQTERDMTRRAMFTNKNTAIAKSEQHDYNQDLKEGRV